jgi:hypothetical protein
VTAEIAIINSNAVALAADSAVTVGRERVWKTANKLFSLGPKHDIGIMMYGGADFLGFPWEVVIKEFRVHARTMDYATVKDCADDFRSFLDSGAFKSAVSEYVSAYLLFDTQMNNLKLNLRYAKKVEFRRKLCDKIDNFLKAYRDRSALIGDAPVSLKAFRNEWDGDIKKMAAEAFGELITKAVLKQLAELMYEVSLRQVPSDYESGIVIAGYGKDELLPHVIHYNVDGRCGGRTRLWCRAAYNLNDEDTSTGLVVPFAQSDIMYVLMEGISRQHINFIDRTLTTVMNEKSDAMVKSFVPTADQPKEIQKQRRENRVTIEAFEKEFAEYRRTSLVKPVLDVVASLPKEEMADMAQAMVEITSLRRRVDSPLESVGGPVDVAVISKGDGFIWIKRKHYFNIELNRDFLYRKHTQAEDL